MKRALLRLLRSALTIYFLVIVFFAACQNRLLYVPGKTPGSEEKIRLIARQAGLERWLDAAGHPIGWRQLARPGQPAEGRMIVFHGNAGTAFDRDFYVRGFGRLENGRPWQVFLFEYPGYDGQPGEPGEGAIRTAARSALQGLLAEDRRPVFLLGESLGSGAACAVASEQPKDVAGLFLLTPFSSVGGVAHHHYPWLPISLILRDRWDNVSALEKYAGPVAVLIAAEDEVVTAEEGRKLYAGYYGVKRQWVIPDAGHNNVPNSSLEPWWQEVSDFLRGAAGSRLSTP